MAHIQPVIKCELDHRNPVQEICAVIMAVTAFHPGQEQEILNGIIRAAQTRIEQIEGGCIGDGESVL